MTIAQAMDIWLRAAKEELGLIVTAEDKEDILVFRPTLYQARKQMQNPQLENFVICLPGDNPCELMIVRKTVELD